MVKKKKYKSSSGRWTTSLKRGVYFDNHYSSNKGNCLFKKNPFKYIVNKRIKHSDGTQYKITNKVARLRLQEINRDMLSGYSETDIIEIQKLFDILDKSRDGRSKSNTKKKPEPKQSEKKEVWEMTKDELKEEPVEKTKEGIIVEWSEGRKERNYPIDDLDELNTFLMDAGKTENPTQTYIKNKVLFDGVVCHNCSRYIEDHFVH